MAQFQRARASVVRRLQGADAADKDEPKPRPQRRGNGEEILRGRTFRGFQRGIITSPNILSLPPHTTPNVQLHGIQCHVAIRLKQTLRFLRFRRWGDNSVLIAELFTRFYSPHDIITKCLNMTEKEDVIYCNSKSLFSGRIYGWTWSVTCIMHLFLKHCCVLTAISFVYCFVLLFVCMYMYTFVYKAAPTVL